MQLQIPAMRRWVRRRAVVIAGGSVVLGVVVVVLAYLQADVPDPLRFGLVEVESLVKSFGVRSAVFLLYVEESGIPLPVPGDVWVMYVGAHIPRNWLYWLGYEIALVAAVVLGASNLYLISRRIGPSIARGRLGHLMHLTPERLARAERWFNDHGVLAIVFGRHIPGLRVPLTVAAGAFKVPYPKFAFYVAISSAIWAGVFLFIGISFGSRVTHYLELHRSAYWLFLLPLGVAVASYFYARSRKAKHDAVKV